MKVYGFAVALLAAGLLATAASAASDRIGKNVLDVTYRTLPSDPAEVLKGLSWSTNFRPYGKAAAEMLVSDTGLQRAVAGEPAKEDTTALAVTCDAEGFTVCLFCADRRLASAFATTNAIPSPSLEVFVMPGDADCEEIEQYFMTAGPIAKTMEYPNYVQDRDNRFVRPYMTCTEEFLPAGILCRIRYDWAAFRDRLPVFPDRADNFWRLLVIRWGIGGRTWGGTVHKISEAGLVRWPAFTAEQKTAILAATLRKGWTAFNEYVRRPGVSFNFSYMDPADWDIRWREEERLAGRSFVYPNEDRAFRPRMFRLFDEARALGPGIARFAQMTPSERDAFYLRAQDVLFNVGYDVKKAEGEYDENKIFGRN